MLPWKSNQYYILCVCITYLVYLANKSHLFFDPLYCHLWSVWLYHSLPHYLTNGRIFEKKKHFIEYKTCFDFLHNIAIFIILNKLSEMLLQMYIGLQVKYQFFFQILIKLEFSRHIFGKSSI